MIRLFLFSLDKSAAGAVKFRLYDIYVLQRYHNSTGILALEHAESLPHQSANTPRPSPLVAA
jgi:hypothetical protein